MKIAKFAFAPIATLSVAIFAAFAAFGEDGVLYVKPGGSDSASGADWENALATPQVAVDKLGAEGGTVYLGEGTFTGAQTILNVTNAVRIIGAGKGKTYLVPDNSSAASTIVLAHPAGIVSGVSVIGNTKAAAVRFTGNAGRLEDSCVGTNSYLGVQFSNPSTGVVSRCEISGNVGSYGGLQMHCNTAKRCFVENTLFKDNRAREDRGGACFTYYGGKGVFNSCTFVGNSGPRGAYSGHYTGDVVFNNCVFRGNTCTSTLQEMNFSLVSSSITVDHCWTFDGYGKDPVTGALNFTDPVGGDFTLRYGSCCRDAAKTLGGEATALDLVGNPRLSGAAPDVGCYEFQEEGLQCDVMTSADESASGSEVTFSAVCSQEGDYVYAWTLKDASGAVVATGTDAEWTAEIVANGYLSAELTVKDSSGEASVSSTKVANIVLVRPGETFVKPAGTEGVTPEYPYDTWAKATTSIEDAIEAVTTGGTVTLADGVHTLTEQLKIEKAVTVRSQNGRDKTVIEQTTKGPRVLKLNNAQAVVTGVTLRRGRLDTYYARKDGDSGAGVWITGVGGTVSDCRITDCAPSNYGSGVVTIGSSGGHVTRCIIDDNSYRRYWSSPYGSGSAGVVISSGQIDNCLVLGNSGVECSGICVSGAARVLNCTVVDNVSSSESGGGLRLGELTSGKGLVQNCIVMNNKGNEDKKTSVGYPEWRTTVSDAAKLAVISNSVVTCTFGKDFAWPLGETYVNEDPMFNDPESADYSLNGASPLINAGTDYEGVEADRDLAQLPRKSGSSVDVGSYEYDLSKRSVTFTVEPRLAFAGEDVILTGSVQGGDGGVDYAYDWAVLPTGKTEVSATGSDNPLVINTLKPGMYDVRLVVSETDSGLSVGSNTVLSVLQVAPKTNYVAVAEGYEGTGGEWPYDTPEKATTNIQTAIDAAVPGSCVCLVDGVHKLTEQLVITKAITLCGQHGRNRSVLEQTTAGPRVLKIDNADAVVEGLTICKGRINTYYAKKNGDNGAGVWITGAGGTLRDCRVTDCAPSNYGTGVVTVDSNHGRVTRCLIDDNSYWRYWSSAYSSGSAGVVISYGQIDSCLVRGNSGVKCSGITASGRARVINCTVVGNTTSSESAGGLSIGEISSGWGCIWNTIVIGNVGNATKSSATGYPEWMTSVSDAAKLSIVSNSVVTCSFGKDFAWPLGTAYVNEEPLFNDETAGDYTLNGNSKLVNAGTDYEGIEADADLSGLPRKSGASVDLGCHEFDLSKRTVDFVVSPAAALAGDAMSFSALVLGGEESVGYAFAWTLQNLDVPGDPIVRNGQILSLDILPPGRYSATVTVTETDGETVVGTKTVPLAAQVGAKTNYVVAAEGYVGDGGRWPYDTWERATTNVMVALETSFPNAVVCLGDGEHVITNTLKVEKSVTVMGLNGWEKTTLRHDTKAGKARVVLINDQKARVEGLTLTGGNAENEGNGLAVRIAAKGGTLSHCRVTGNEFPLMGMQGAVSVLYDASVGGIGVVENCVIDNNTHGSYQYYGTAGGVYLQSGILRNCLIFKNKGTQFGGVGIYGPAIVQNCTIVSNIVEGCKGVSSMDGGGGVNFCQKNQSVRLENCIIAFNRCGSDASDFNIATTVDTRLYPEDAAKDLVAITNNAMQVVRNCLIGDGTEIGRNQVMGLPVFRKVGATAVDGNWRLRSRSPGYKTGLYDASWMADGVDIYGEPRTKHTSQLDGPLVDIGAAEADWRGTGLSVIVR